MTVDIHNHILPGIDDGAGSLDEATEMARLAVADGCDTMVATPHRAWLLRRDAEPEWVRRNVAVLQAHLDRQGVRLRILPGVEIKVGRRVAEQLAYGEIGTLGDAGRAALLELPFSRIPADALENLEAVRDAGFDVVLAHPERYLEVQKNLSFVEACADLGIIFQITTGSLIGEFGEQARQTADEIVRRAPAWKIVLASDAHDARPRHPGLMTRARDAAARLVGPETAAEMVDALPRALVTPKTKA